MAKVDTKAATTITLEMKQEKDTKNMVRYGTEDDGTGKNLNIYLPKAQLTEAFGAIPGAIQLEVSAV